MELVRKDGDYFYGVFYQQPREGSEIRYSGVGAAVDYPTTALDLVDLVAEPAPVRTVSPAPEPAPSDLPHEELIQAVLDGKTVQYQSMGEWVDMRNRAYALRRLLSATDGDQFRLKPETEVVWAMLYTNGGISGGYNSKADLLRGNSVKWWVRITREVGTLRIVDIQHEEPK